MRRRARLDWFAEQYRKTHGYYPSEATPTSKKRYNPLHDKLRAEHQKRQARIEGIKDAAARKRERKKQFAFVPGGKFRVSDHYEDPPDNN